MAKEGDTVEPGVKIAAISKSGEGATEAASQPSPPKEEEKSPKAETAPIKETAKEPSPPPPKPKAPSPPPPRATASEPVLPPKDRERRVSLRICKESTISKFSIGEKFYNTLFLISRFL